MCRCNDVQQARGQEIVCVGSWPPESFGCFLSGACVVQPDITQMLITEPREVFAGAISIVPFRHRHRKGHGTTRKQRKAVGVVKSLDVGCE